MSNRRNFKSLRTASYFKIKKKPLFVLSRAVGRPGNLIKRKDSELRSPYRCTFINILADSQGTCTCTSRGGGGGTS